MTYQQELEMFAVERAIKLTNNTNADFAERTLKIVKSERTITQRVGMYLAGDYSRATINLAKLDELLLVALAE